MNIDKGRLAMNLIIYVIISVVLTAIFAATGTGDSLGPQIIAGFSGSLLLYIPVRLFPQLGLIGSVIVLFVISFLDEPSGRDDRLSRGARAPAGRLYCQPSFPVNSRKPVQKF